MARGNRLTLAAVAACAALSGCRTGPAELTVPVLRSAAEVQAAVGGLAGKVVVVNFWATWCPPCVQEFPSLVAVRDEYRRRDVVLVTVSANDEGELESKVKPFLQEHGVRDHAFLIAAPDENKFIDEFYPEWSGSYPATFLYDRQGKIVKSLVGEQSLEQLKAAVESVLSST